MQDQYSNFRNKIKSYTETNQRKSIKVFSYKFPDFTGYGIFYFNLESFNSEYEFMLPLHLEPSTKNRT